MSLIILAKFISTLNLSAFEKKALSSCTFYGRSEKNYTHYFCGCKKALGLYGKKIDLICIKKRSKNVAK